MTASAPDSAASAHRTVRAVSLTGYVAAAEKVGLDPYSMLRERGLSAARLRDPEWSFEAEAVLSLLEDSAHRSGRPDFGILMAEYRSFASLGPIALLLEHSANPAAVITALDEFRHLLSDVFRIDVDEYDDVAVIRCMMPHGRPGLQTSSIIVALAYRALSHASGGRWQPDCVHFVHEKPQRNATFERYFQAPLEFSSNFDGFSCPKQALLVANPLADEQMAEHARSLLRLLRAPVAPKSILDLAMQAISLLIGSRQPTVAAVASNLGFSTRTLQRALKREGRSFASLLDETRRQLAVRYLAASSTPIYLIAEMVGYADSSSFSRWFTREFGETPLAFRLRNRSSHQDADS